MTRSILADQSSPSTLEESDKSLLLPPWPSNESETARGSSVPPGLVELLAA